MGSHNGVENCELVGAYILHQITEKYGNKFGLYRDDGLGISKESPRRVEAIKKGLCSIFNSHGLKITIEANKQIVNFLDVTLNLSNGKYTPYSKPNNTPQYVHNKSNHPPGISKNVPKAINKQLCEISSDKDSFDIAVPLYQKSIDKSGYDHVLKFKPPSTNEDKGYANNRARNVIWYNLPYNKAVSSNIGRDFLRLIDEEFPKDHTLSKIFNRNTIKVSYGCMTNVKQAIDGRNKTILNNQTTAKRNEKQCNCRKPQDCPVNGRCLNESVIYQATVKTDNGEPEQTYVGLTANSFKTRYANHKASFKNEKKKSNTELSKYIWKLKENNIEYRITWRILKRARAYNPESDRCNLYLWEKFFIIYKPQLSTLNKRNEFVTACRHSSKFILRNFIT